MKKLTTILVMVIGCSFNSMAFALDSYNYTKVAEQIISEIEHEKVRSDAEADAIIIQLRKLVKIGMDGMRVYNPKNESDKVVKEMTLNEGDEWATKEHSYLDSNWHNGKALVKGGVKYNDMDHFSSPINQLDSILHPATSIVIMEKYKRTKKMHQQQAVIDQLSEALQHVESIKAGN